jgi:hypothetical protein
MNSRVGGVADENRARPGPPRTGLRPWGGDEAESEGCGGSTVEDENEVWPDLRRNPEGWGQFSSFLRHASLEDSPYSSLLTPRTEKNWLPAPPAGKFITGSSEQLERCYQRAVYEVKQSAPIRHNTGDAISLLVLCIPAFSICVPETATSHRNDGGLSLRWDACSNPGN